MAEHIKRMVAVAFLVASVPVLLLPGKLKNSLASEPETLTNLEADKLSKELLVLGQMMSNFEQEHVIHGTISGASSGKSRRLSLENPKQRGSSEQHGGTENAEPRRLSAASTTLQRRAVYTRWGSKTCPMGSKLIYSGFMSTSLYSHTGSGYNMLCMHPSPQMPSGYDAANNDGALLYGVEYENTGAIDRHHDYDAACAVCQWGAGGSVYVEWGNAESRDNPSTPKTCGNPAHEMIYTGLIMSEKYDHRKGEFICVDLERDYVGEAAQSDDNHNGGLLYTTEMEQGAADEYAYPHDREVGCTVCGIPGKSVNADGRVTVTPESETAVFTVWGKKQCPGEGVSSEQLYTGFVAGSHYNHGGSGANQICMTTSNPNAPSGFSDGNQNGALLYGAEYQNTGAIDANHDGDAACVVCRYLTPHRDVYVQWGRSSSCSNSHAAVYNGYSMGEKFTHHRSTRVCVHTARETHARSDWSDHNGALLYTTELEMSVSGVAANAEVGCSSCAGAGGKSVYTRWGSRSCPVGSSLLYEGNMMAEHYTHRGGGANTICMHPQMQNPAGWSSGNENGDLLYKMEYQNTGAIDANHDHEAACAVCELAHWESVYTQWGRSTTCASGHLTLYTGFIMSERYNHNKGEFLCVDSERAVTANSNGGDQNGGLLYTSEMEHGSSQGDQYPHNVEVGCSVCAAEMQELEVPFVRQTEVAANGESYFKNAIHGEWVKVASLTAGQSATVSYGYTASGGTSSSERETQESAQARANDMSSCTSTSFTASTKSSAWASASAGFFVTSTTKVQVDVGFSSTTGLETCGGETNTQATSIARAMTQATKWDQSFTESRSFSLSIPSQIPAGVPEAETMSTLGVDVWQWEWTIGEGAHDDVSAKMYKSKSESRFVFVPVPTGTTERRPCCKPTQEYGVLWYPFNCKTAEGLLPGAESAAHCKVGAPGDSPAQQWSAQEVVEWLDTLGLGASQAPPPAAWTQDGTCILGPGSQRLLVQDDTSEGTSYPDDMRAADCWSACVARGSYGCCRINYDWTPARCHWDPTGMTSTPSTGSSHWASNIQAHWQAVVAARKLDGPAIDSLVRFVDESPATYTAIGNVFGTISTGDALKILRGLIQLRSAR